MPSINNRRNSASIFNRYSKYQPVIMWFLLWLVISLLLLAGCTNKQTTWDKIQASGVLRVGLDPTFPPFEVADDKNVWGLDVDLAKALAAEMALATEFTYFGYDGLYDALGTNQVDILISALVIVPERMGEFAYSDSYFDAGQVLVVDDGTQINDPQDLEERTVAVELGAQGHLLATTWQRRIPGLNIEVEDSLEDALFAVANGDADAAVVDHVSARLYRENAPNLQIYLLSDAREPYALVVRVEDRQLLEALNQALEKLKSSGKLESIIHNWLDPN